MYVFNEIPYGTVQKKPMDTVVFISLLSFNVGVVTVSILELVFPSLLHRYISSVQQWYVSKKQIFFKIKSSTQKGRVRRTKIDIQEVCTALNDPKKSKSPLVIIRESLDRQGFMLSGARFLNTEETEIFWSHEGKGGNVQRGTLRKTGNIWKAVH